MLWDVGATVLIAGAITLLIWTFRFEIGGWLSSLLKEREDVKDE